MTKTKEKKRGYMVWVEEDKIDAVLEILNDNQVCLSDVTQYNDYEQLINYFTGLKAGKPTATITKSRG